MNLVVSGHETAIAHGGFPSNAKSRAPRIPIGFPLRHPHPLAFNLPVHPPASALRYRPYYRRQIQTSIRWWLPCEQTLSSANDCRKDVEGRKIAKQNWLSQHPSGALRRCILQEEATPRETLEAFNANGTKRSASRWLPKWRQSIAVVSGKVMRTK